MNKPEITKEKFADYRRCQILGAYNMFNYEAYREAGLTKLSADEWNEIIWHYSEYKQKFNI